MLWNRGWSSCDVNMMLLWNRGWVLLGLGDEKEAGDNMILWNKLLPPFKHSTEMAC